MARKQSDVVDKEASLPAASHDAYVAEIRKKDYKLLQGMESRFQRIAGLANEDLTPFPLKQVSNQEINKDKSKEFGEVFTPLWLVDSMIKQVKWKQDHTTLDLCAGYGQFSIRLFRAYFLKFNKREGFDFKAFVKQHSFAELQATSCHKLMRIFGVGINLFIGDATQLGKVPEGAKGIWLYVEAADRWVCATKTVKNMMASNELAADGKKLPVSEDVFAKKIETLTAYLNATYKEVREEMEANVKVLKASKGGRLAMLKLAKEAAEGTSLQGVTTPESVVADMLTQVDDLEHKSVLVLFNGEILEGLIHDYKVPAGQITFATDFADEFEAKFFKALYGVDYKLISDPAFIPSAFKGKTYDVVLSNPPYTDGLDLKIMQALIGANVAKEYVVVHPAAWLIDLKHKNRLYTNFKSAVSGRVKSVKVFNGNKEFGIMLFVPCAVIHIVPTHYGDISVEYFDDKYSVTSIDEVTKFGKAYDQVVKPFIEVISEECEKNPNMWSHNVSHLPVDASKKYCQLVQIRGHVSKEPNTIVSDDFYTLVMIDHDNNKGIRTSNVNKPRNHHLATFAFDTDDEVENFLCYLKTDFVRFCLAIFKMNAQLNRGEMDLIPWLDFTQSWDDEKLFAHFNIDQDTQDYIRAFLPDYYGIRKPKTIAA